MAMRIISREEARPQGLKRFFTGNACSNGHVADRFVGDGSCQSCLKDRTAKWRAQNRQVWKDSSRASKQRHQARYTERQRADFLENPEKYREAVRRYYAANTAYMKARAAAHGRKRRAQKRGSSGDHTLSQIRDLLTAQDHRCIYCGADLREISKHLDHIMPLALGGSNGIENLQWLCAPCNLSKGAKDPVVFARERQALHNEGNDHDRRREESGRPGRKSQG